MCETECILNAHFHSSMVQTYISPHTPSFPYSFSLCLSLSLTSFSPPDWEQGAVLKPATRGKELEVRMCYEFSQGWLRQSLAEARFSGTISSMGNRKFVKWAASSADQPYFSTRTSNRDHGLSLVMCRNSPAEGSREKTGWKTIYLANQQPKRLHPWTGVWNNFCADGQQSANHTEHFATDNITAIKSLWGNFGRYLYKTINCPYV